MDRTGTLIIGAGISGLATAAFSGASDYLVIEADKAIGGYCKTIKRAGFVWDYSGHFFHFKDPSIEAWLRERMPGQLIRTVEKRSSIAYKGALIDFPFQKNIHQLSKDEFIECLHDLFFARASHDLLGSDALPSASETTFREMLYARFGRAIAEKFLIPYNEKLYACDLGELDKDAMGRFFPHASLVDIIRNMKVANNRSYNSTFSYPAGGAIEYVKALASGVDPSKLSLDEALISFDLSKKIAKTTKREIAFERMVSSIPLNRLLNMGGLPHDTSVFSWNKVLVFNLGFDRKGPRNDHWIYYPSRDRIFYRVGFYDNIFDADRMSLYVETSFAKDASIEVGAVRERVLRDLALEGIITDHVLVAEHSVVMDPAYVHIGTASNHERERVREVLAQSDVYSIGRYGGWTYCSIEDNIVEARAILLQLGIGNA